MTAGGGEPPEDGPASALVLALPPPGMASAPVRPPRTGRLRFWIGTFAICAASGALYGAIETHGRPLVGAVFGLCTGGAVMLYEQGLVAPGVRERLRRLPLVASVLATEIVYLLMIMLGAALAGALMLATGGLKESWREAMILGPVTMIYALLVSGVVITMARMRELIGAEVFGNLLLGRYHHPVEEERIFLFLDLIGSTAYAQKHGDLRAQAFLSAIFAALAAPVRRHRGAIDDYIGDMAMVTWPLARGATDGRCIACLFDFFAAVERDADQWRRSFGQVPRFRAALHGGRIVTADVGIDRHKISYFGDVVNTTGRLESLCRTLDVDVLVSSDLLDRILVMPAGIAPRALGTHAVKGRGQSLSVFALEPASAEADPIPHRSARVA